MADVRSAAAAAAPSALPEASRILVWDEGGRVLFSSFDATTTDLPALAGSLADREAAVRAGLNLDGARFEVHRHYPPLVYGRAMGAHLAPEDAEGVALCAAGGRWGGDGGGASGGSGASPAVFGVITYPLPHVSAKMVPKLQAFMGTVAGAGRR